MEEIREADKALKDNKEGFKYTMFFIDRQPQKMIFSSYGFRSPIVREKIAKVITQDNNLKTKSCLVLPFAGFSVEKTFEAERLGLAEFGFDSERVFNADCVVLEATFVPDFIYIPGGNPFKLLAEIRKRNLVGEVKRWVLDCKSTYIGVSAGAYFATQNIEYVKQLENNNVIESDYSALGLVSNIIVCHTNHYSSFQISACEDVAGKTAIVLRDDQIIVYENPNWEYVK